MEELDWIGVSMKLKFNSIQRNKRMNIIKENKNKIEEGRKMLRKFFSFPQRKFTKENQIEKYELINI